MKKRYNFVLFKKLLSTKEQWLKETKHITVFYRDEYKHNDEPCFGDQYRDLSPEARQILQDEIKNFCEESYKKAERCIEDITYENLRNNIKESGMRIGDFAEMLKMSRKSISNLSQEKVAVSRPLFVISVLVREMHRAGLDFVSIIDNIPLEFKKRKRKNNKT